MANWKYTNKKFVVICVTAHHVLWDWMRKDWEMRRKYEEKKWKNLSINIIEVENATHKKNEKKKRKEKVGSWLQTNASVRMHTSISVLFHSLKCSHIHTPIHFLCLKFPGWMKQIGFFFSAHMHVYFSFSKTDFFPSNFVCIMCVGNVFLYECWVCIVLLA